MKGNELEGQVKATTGQNNKSQSNKNQCISWELSPGYIDHNDAFSAFDAIELIDHTFPGKC